ncbi:hypothetical protein SAMN02745857_02823 [Andreprevotia lacus DSM 23236]|jgi:hypothetical protein|uniref:Alginate export n=1 Tax=Andreprevotia lacus DSM 23236 TaxID=1121001 RepID=A0A1W1XTW0_9NEIS|nr:hypothetical protein [Andreprevotia lacus]SMC27326.1 hypothetical protein SAMN02745857_02823 [Andreprevotia lacus DSM 23236]
MHTLHKPLAVLLLGLGALAPAGHALAGDEDALNLADNTQASTEQARDWRLLIEGAIGGSDQRDGTQTRSQRVSASVELDTRLAPDWRLVLSDRVDQRWSGTLQDGDAINTLRDAYVSWQASPTRALDVGRINTRYGVAMGYNPTDWFAAGAVRSRVSEDPGSLRDNRQGSVMLRGQQLWDGGAATLLYSPKLADHREDGSFNPDWGRTNGQDRALLSVSTRLSDSLSPEWLLYHQAGGAPQLGLNLSWLANPATVAYLEWSGGRQRSQLAQALGGDDTAFRQRLAIGATYTTDFKLSTTVEYDYNGAGLDDDGWQALQAGNPGRYWAYRGTVSDLQALPTRHAWFIRAAWQDALINHLDLTGMLRINGDDHSRMSWLEARYHWDKTDVALQWQHYGGNSGSEYGALPQRQLWQVLLTRYF